MNDQRTVPDPHRFLRHGRLESMPRRWRDQSAVTRLLATRALPVLLEPVGERELTDRLSDVARDPVALRRAMIDFGIVHRTRDGSEYWRTERTEYEPEPGVPGHDGPGRGPVGSRDA